VRKVFFFDSIPKNASGKILRRNARDTVLKRINPAANS
jgi:acyl-coenzyme A synthetase/AMP-(fatty) acid ligase